MRGLKQTFNYGNDSLFITDLLGKNEIVNYLEKGKRLTYSFLREKLRKELRKHGKDLRELVDDYNLQNPPQPQREFRDDLYGAQRIRQNLPKKDTKGRVIFERPRKKKPQKRDNVVTKNLRNQSEKLNWDGIYFPTSLCEIDIFDNLNKISTMVLGWDEEKKRVIYLRFPKTKYEKTSQLFYHDNHYSFVRDLPKLLRLYFHDNFRYFCHYCTFQHRTKDVAEFHMEECRMDKITIEKMPKECSIVEFNIIVFKPFTIWADYECRTEIRFYHQKGDKTELIQNHKPSG